MYDLVLTQIIYRMDPEFAHRFAVKGFRYGGRLLRLLGGRRVFPAPSEGAAVHALGLTFPAPLGLAAGMDKNAEAVPGLAAAGFSHIEIGTVTARAQPGNEKPRSWREKDVRGLRNRMGFNNEGADAVARRLARLRAHKSGRDVILGVNIGKTKVTPAEEAPTDYGYSARLLAPYADYLVVNVSSPNTPGLRDLQSTEALRPILEHVRIAADDAVGDRHVPLLVKIAPDLADEDVDAVADLALELGLDGIVATNTTIGHDRGPGGLSGPPVLPRALEVIARLRARVGERMCLIGVGGITSVEDAQAMLDAGATLLQGYTAFVYEGPAWPARINAGVTPRR
ncbi:quinone-dependent dihydroorotate dehydrogenase [Demequina sp. NBRC 110054]|uniref:quinone-dependent dihydroorotate dehydrogenase n=1 Tax=Demequina sp. NBRC 110054 TaxID=1570343 RepID=UPI0009FEAD27|nr:quinone-dependent dihydroorotate dehydrogenase [Demequina sp. NBRC 110054]